MKPSLIAQRSAQAQAQILAAVEAMAAGVNIDASGLAVTNHDPAIQAMLRWEALAALLTAVLKPGAAVDPVTAPASAPAKPTKKGETHAL